MQANNTGPTRAGTINVNGQTFTITEPAASCTYAISNQNPSTNSAGGLLALTLTTQAGCPWTIVPQSISVSASPSSGVGSATVNLTIPSNYSVFSTSLAVQAASQQVVITQYGVCTYSPSDNSTGAAVSALAGTASVNLTANLAACPYDATSDQSWLRITNVSYPGSSAAIAYSFLGNYTGASRTAHIVLNGPQYTITQPPAPALEFVPVTPCRVLDTRKPAGPFGGPAIAGQTSRSFIIPDSACGIPASALAYSLNVAVVPQTALGYLTVWPSGAAQPVVSTLNSLDARVKANAAIVPAGANGAVSVFASNPTDLIVDINGYFVPAGSTTSALAFYPITPCRITDTRKSNGAFGSPSLTALGTRDFPINQSACGIPASAQAYSLNFTVVPPGTLAYLTVWPAGRPSQWFQR